MRVPGLLQQCCNHYMLAGTCPLLHGSRCRPAMLCCELVALYSPGPVCCMLCAKLDWKHQHGRGQPQCIACKPVSLPISSHNQLLCCCANQGLKCQCHLVAASEVGNIDCATTCNRQCHAVVFPNLLCSVSVGTLCC